MNITDRQRGLLQLLVTKEEEGRGQFHLATNFGGGWSLGYSHGHNVPGEFDEDLFFDLQEAKLIRLTCLTVNLLYTGRPTAAGIEVIQNNAPPAQSVLGPNQPKALELMKRAMEMLELNVPSLTNLVAQELKPQRKKVDRSTIYRIMDGTTRHPDPATREALIKILKLSEDKATEVRGFLGPFKTSK